MQPEMNEGWGKGGGRATAELRPTAGRTQLGWHSNVQHDMANVPLWVGESATHSARQHCENVKE